MNEVCTTEKRNLPTGSYQTKAEREACKEMLEYALNARTLGFCVMPAREDFTKAPFGNSPIDQGWKNYTVNPSASWKISYWYLDCRLSNMGIITGKVSGDLECMDFDDMAAYNEFKSLLTHDTGLLSLVKKIEDGYCEKTPRGIHWLYRVTGIRDNLKSEKLARRYKEASEKKSPDDKVKTLIETKSEGGYVITAPTPAGKVNDAGAYTILSGSLATVATITLEERTMIHNAAKTMDRLPSPAALEDKTVVYSKQDIESGLNRPGDDYNSKMSWDDVLTPFGWSKTFTNSANETAWTRPGKDFGISATTNYKGSDLLYVFTTSTSMEPGATYSKFAVYCHYHHGGDFEVASMDLRERGFGDPEYVETRKLRFKDNATKLANLPKKKLGDIEAFRHTPTDMPFEFMDVPGLVNDLRENCLRHASYKQPTLAFAGALALAGLAMGRRVRTQTGLRSNFLILSLADSGTGKEAAREMVRRVLYDSGNSQYLGAEEIGSAPGLIDEMHAKGGQLIYQLDEIGKALGNMTSTKASSYQSDILSTMMKLETAAASDKPFIGRALKATKEGYNRKDIENPILIVHGTTIPSRYYNAISYDNVDDGFVPRFITFQSFSEVAEKDWELPSDRRTEGYVIDKINYWLDPVMKNSIITNAQEPPIRTIRHTNETMSIMQKFAVLSHARYIEHKKDNFHAIWARTNATAERIALVFACSRNPEATHIDLTSALQAVSVTRYLADQQILRLTNHLSQNEYERELKLVRRLIVSAGKEGITLSALTRATTSISQQRRADYINSLFDGGFIEVEKRKLSSSTKGSTILFAAKQNVFGDDVSPVKAKPPLRVVNK